MENLRLNVLILFEKPGKYLESLPQDSTKSSQIISFLPDFLNQIHKKQKTNSNFHSI